MAVYTDVSNEDLESFLKAYNLGDILSFKGIAEGVENTNYFLHTSAGFYILTLYEKRVDARDLPFFLKLLDHLSEQGLTCPQPLHTQSGEALQQLNGRPAALFTFLDGVSIRRPSAQHCGEAGRVLGELHLKGLTFPLKVENKLSSQHWREIFKPVKHQADQVSADLSTRIDQELDYLASSWPHNLPQGIIHADYFTDNVFFTGPRLSGVIDFYFACHDALAYDLAIALNAWCFEADGSFNITKGRAMMEAYHKARPLGLQEIEALPVLCRGAALRFLLTRLTDWLNVPEGALVRPKDPLEYDKKLSFHRHVKHASDYGWSGKFL